MRYLKSTLKSDALKNVLITERLVSHANFLNAIAARGSIGGLSTVFIPLISSGTVTEKNIALVKVSARKRNRLITTFTKLPKGNSAILILSLEKNECVKYQIQQ